MVENEYAGRHVAIRQLMEARCDSSALHIRWTLAGHWKPAPLIEDNLCDRKFASKADYNLARCRNSLTSMAKWPIMCMEFWDGWFTAGKSLSSSDPDELARCSRSAPAGLNQFYMFHGGTNFGFMNGCLARGCHWPKPQVTSYDYDALLNERGNPTDKYYAVQRMLKEHYPEYPQMEPLVESELRNIPLSQKVSPWDIARLGSAYRKSHPMKMEELGQMSPPAPIELGPVGMLIEFVSLMAATVCSSVDGQHITQYQTEIGQGIMVDGQKRQSTRLIFLIGEYGSGQLWPRLADTQQKGFRTGVCKDPHFLLDSIIHKPLDHPEKDRLFKRVAEKA